jgi:putative nucleotidyltransferase with HDIG domain
MVHILTDITDQKKVEEEIKESLNQTKRTFEQTVAALSQLVEVRDPYTSGHQKKVADIATAIAKDLGLKKDTVEAIRLAALIHDIGKIAIPASILSKPGKLTDIERDMIETHPKIGYEIVKEIDFPYPIAKIILQHHEKIDGSGYPNGLKGKDIMQEAKIIVVADVFEAMSSHRPYREANTLKESFNEILKNSGVLYDADVVDSCVRVLSKQ